MKRQSNISNHVSVVVTREVNRVKQLLMVKQMIDTIDVSSGTEVEVEVFSLPNAVCLWRSAPAIAKRLVKELLHKDFKDEMTFPLVPSKILPVGETEEFICMGSVSYDPNADNATDVSTEGGQELYWLSVREAYYLLSKQMVHDEDFKEDKLLDLHSLVTLSILHTMKLLG